LFEGGIVKNNSLIPAGGMSVKTAAATSRVVDIKTAAEAAWFNPKAARFDAKVKNNSLKTLDTGLRWYDG